MVEELFDEGLLTAAESWLKVSEEKIPSYEPNDTNHVNLHDMKKKIEEFNIEDDEKKRFEKLCAKSKTTGDYKTFQNASTSCRYVQDGKNLLMVMKLEELSKEPKVNIVHDFLTNLEVEQFLKESANYDFDWAPTTGDSNDQDTYSESRIADSYFIDEKKDSLAELTKKVKNRYKIKIFSYSFLYFMIFHS